MEGKLRKQGPERSISPKRPANGNGHANAPNRTLSSGARKVFATATAAPAKIFGSFRLSSRKLGMLEDEHNNASEEIEEMLGATRPKNLRQGLTSGLGYIVQGAVGAVGIALLMPGIGVEEGSKKGGIVGGIIGGVGGAVGGVMQAANVLGGGLVTGVGQVVRGAAASPSALLAPGQGKWWNANEGKWIATNLLEEERWLKTQSEFDQDILGSDAIPEDARPFSSGKKVKDPYYYDLLTVDPSVDAAMIKRRYYIIARKYGPARCGANPKAQEEFEEIGRAYVILMNAELREKYDRVGREGLWKETEEIPQVDPFLLYSCLFGSDKFNDYIGRLASATDARVGGEHNSKVSLKQSRLLQKRRVTRLALKLSDRLENWSEGKWFDVRNIHISSCPMRRSFVR
jgi:hypothetical protein